MPCPARKGELGERMAGERLHVELLGRAVPLVRTPDGMRAVNKGKPGNPAQVEKYLAGKFDDRLEGARAAVAELAGFATGRPPSSRIPSVRAVPPVGPVH